MPQLNRLQLPQLTDLVQRKFEKAKEELKTPLRNSGIIVEESISEGTGGYRRFAEMVDRDLYASIKDEGDNASQAIVQYGYEKDMAIYRVAKDISITVEERKQNKYPEVISKLTDLSTVCMNRLELDLAHRLGFAWSTTYVEAGGRTIDISTGDTLAVISTVHTLTGSATTYSTQITGNPIFSKGALETAQRSAVEESFNNIGQKIMIEFDKVVTTDDRATINQVQELMNATADVTSNNAATYNVYRSALTHIISPHIATTASGGVDTTKRKYWFLVSSKASEFRLGTLEAPFLKTPAAGNNGEDFSTENWTYGARASYGIAIVTARFIRGSKGDGSA